MFANLTVTTGAPADVLTLPRTAIVYSLYGDNVFVVVAARRSPSPARTAAARRRPAGRRPHRRAALRPRSAPVRGERIAIAEGMKAGERVVTAGQIKLQANIAGRPSTSARRLPPPAETPRP